MNRPLFVYGTLQVPQVQRRVIGRMVEGRAARLRGYRCGLVERADFPGIVPCSDSEVSGLILEGLSLEDYQRLDRYEGELYRREWLSVEYGADDVRRLHCWIYVIVRWARQRVTSEPWSQTWYVQQPATRFTYRG